MTLRNFDGIQEYLSNDVNILTLEEAIRNVKSGKSYIFGFSGHKSSGKDTLASNFVEMVKKRDGLEIESLAFAGSLKQEVTSVLASIEAVIKGGNSIAETTERMSKLYDIPIEQMSDIMHIMHEFLDPKKVMPNGWKRSKEVWAVLTYLGTDVRQPQDKYHWVKKTFDDMIGHLATGKSVVITDVRFLHEVQPTQYFGGFVTRVDIDPKVQLERLFERDGVVPDEATLSHKSETALDDYDEFDFRIDNSTRGGLLRKTEDIYEAWKNFSENYNV